MLSLAGAATPWALNLGALGEAAAATATDHKARVCVCLQGDNDHANTVVPYDAASHAAYAGMRPAFAYTRSALAPAYFRPWRTAFQSEGGRDFKLMADSVSDDRGHRFKVKADSISS